MAKNKRDDIRSDRLDAASKKLDATVEQFRDFVDDFGKINQQTVEKFKESLSYSEKSQVDVFQAATSIQNEFSSVFTGMKEAGIEFSVQGNYLVKEITDSAKEAFEANRAEARHIRQDIESMRKSAKKLHGEERRKVEALIDTAVDQLKEVSDNVSVFQEAVRNRFDPANMVEKLFGGGTFGKIFGDMIRIKRERKKRASLIEMKTEALGDKSKLSGTEGQMVFPFAEETEANTDAIATNTEAIKNTIADIKDSIFKQEKPKESALAKEEREREEARNRKKGLASSLAGGKGAAGDPEYRTNPILRMLGMKEGLDILKKNNPFRSGKDGKKPGLIRRMFSRKGDRAAAGAASAPTDMVTSASSKASKATDTAGRATRRTPKKGVLKRLADGIKSFGRKGVMRGILNLGLLAVAMIPFAIAMKLFSKGVTLGGILAFAASITVMVVAVKALSKMGSEIVKGALALAILGVALVPLAFGLALMKDVGIGTIFVLAGALLVLGAAAAIFGSFAPLLGIGILVIAALGVALLPLAYAMKIAAEAFQTFTDAIDIGKLFLIGPALMLAAPGLLLFGLAAGLASPGLIALGVAALILKAANASETIGGMLEKISLFSQEVKPSKLFAGALGMLALGYALIGFTAMGMLAKAAATTGNVIGNFLTLGGLLGAPAPGPFEMLKMFIAFGEQAPNIQKGAKGIDNLATSMFKFANLDTEKMSEGVVALVSAIDEFSGAAFRAAFYGGLSKFLLGGDDYLEQFIRFGEVGSGIASGAAGIGAISRAFTKLTAAFRGGDLDFISDGGFEKLMENIQDGLDELDEDEFEKKMLLLERLAGAMTEVSKASRGVAGGPLTDVMGTHKTPAGADSTGGPGADSSKIISNKQNMSESEKKLHDFGKSMKEGEVANYTNEDGNSYTIEKLEGGGFRVVSMKDFKDKPDTNRLKMEKGHAKLRAGDALKILLGKKGETIEGERRGGASAEKDGAGYIGGKGSGQGYRVGGRASWSPKPNEAATELNDQMATSPLEHQARADANKIQDPEVELERLLAWKERMEKAGPRTSSKDSAITHKKKLKILEKTIEQVKAEIEAGKQSADTTPKPGTFGYDNDVDDLEELYRLRDDLQSDIDENKAIVEANEDVWAVEEAEEWIETDTGYLEPINAEIARLEGQSKQQDDVEREGGPSDLEALYRFRDETQNEIDKNKAIVEANEDDWDVEEAEQWIETDTGHLETINAEIARLEGPVRNSDSNHTGGRAKAAELRINVGNEKIAPESGPSESDMASFQSRTWGHYGETTGNRIPMITAASLIRLDDVKNISEAEKKATANIKDGMKRRYGFSSKNFNDALKSGSKTLNYTQVELEDGSQGLLVKADFNLSAAQFFDGYSETEVGVAPDLMTEHPDDIAAKEKKAAVQSEREETMRHKPVPAIAPRIISDPQKELERLLAWKERMEKAGPRTSSKDSAITHKKKLKMIDAAMAKIQNEMPTPQVDPYSANDDTINTNTALSENAQLSSQMQNQPPGGQVAPVIANNQTNVTNNSDNTWTMMHESGTINKESTLQQAQRNSLTNHVL